MINYNLVEFVEWNAVLLYFIIMLLLALGNWIAVKLLKPTYPGWGRVLFGALILFCANIVFSLIFFQIPLLATVFTLLSWYFIIKFLFDYGWGKAILAWLVPIAVTVGVMAALWFLVPGNWVATNLGFKVM